MELFRNTSFDFLGRKWWFILPSLILTLAGAISLFINGGPRYGIDFLGGADMEVRWEGTPPVERIRAAVSSRLSGVTVVAALLTLIGYSMNDTIVVFDRIRENRRNCRRETLAETINRSINQTLSRTVLTSGLTLLTALALLLFGGPVLHGFSLVLVVGIIVGTCSSIFIASPILLAWGQDADRVTSRQTVLPAGGVQ